MTDRAELVSQVRANLRHGLEKKRAQKVLHCLQDELLIPNGLYLNGGLAHFSDAVNLSAEIVGLLTRADGKDVSERDRTKLELWLAAKSEVAEFSVGPLKPSNDPDS
jgi:uncharacterized protein YggL (DUF469 family)